MAGVTPRVQLQHDKEAHTVSVHIDDQETFVYQYCPTDGLSHYYPVRSPYGQSMTVQYPDIWPHHRSFLFADNVGLEGKPAIHFYNAWLLRQKGDDGDNIFPYRIQNAQFLAETRHGDTPTWTKGFNKGRPRWRGSSLNASPPPASGRNTGVKN